MFRLIGSVALFPYDFDPAGWARCDGRTLSGDGNEALFNLLLDTFGGDPNEFTFGLPNLDAAAPKECRYCISLVGSYPQPQGERYEALLGETVIWPIPTVTPRNLVECNGQMLPKNGNQYLESFIDARFGGADAGKFKLPDLRNRNPAKCRYMLSVDGSDPMGNSQRDPFVGELVLLPYEAHEASRDRWRLCDGSQFAPDKEMVLANLLGKRFGGGNDFRFPDLRAAAPPNYNYYLALRGVMPSRS